VGAAPPISGWRYLAFLLYEDNMKAASAPVSVRGDKATPRPPRVRQVPALSRGIAVLRLLGQSDVPLGVQAIARALDLVPSTCLHILRALVADQLITVDPETKKYAVGAGLVALARTALRQNTFSAVVQPDLDELSRLHGATALGVEASGLDHMVVVALARASSRLQIHVEIGSRFPALISATGRCVAAFCGAPWSDIRKRFASLRWDAPPTLTAWREEVKATKVNGYAIDNGQYIRGVSIVASPVIMPDDTINAIVMVGLREQMERAGLPALGEDLHRRALRISRVLGGKDLMNVPASR
jgi:DNA-binding IclR family transcriptional regulator